MKGPWRLSRLDGALPQNRAAVRAALGGRLDEVCGRLNHWGQLCIEAGAFPPDILKRVAG